MCLIHLYLHISRGVRSSFLKVTVLLIFNGRWSAHGQKSDTDIFET